MAAKTKLRNPSQPATERKFLRFIRHMPGSPDGGRSCFAFRGPGVATILGVSDFGGAETAALVPEGVVGPAPLGVSCEVTLSLTSVSELTARSSATYLHPINIKSHRDKTHFKQETLPALHESPCQLPPTGSTWHTACTRCRPPRPRPRRRSH